MTKWVKCKLGDICTLNYGKALTATNRVAGDIPVYSSAGITGSHNVALVQSKGIIVGRKGTVGTVYYSDKPFYCIDTAYYILPDDEKYDFKWLYYRLKSLHLDKLNEDSAVPGLNRETAYAQEFPLPPLEEQRRIAGILGAIDDKIENNRRINDNLEQQAQALYKQWFVDFDFPNEEGKPYKSSGGKMVDSELGPIPDGWRVGLLKDIVNFQSGFPFKSELFSEQGTYRLITIKGVQDGYLDVNGAVYIKNIPNRMPPYCLLTEGEIIMSLTGNVGRCCIVDRENLLLNQRVVKLQPTFINSNMFIYTMFRRESFKEKLIALAKGTAQANLSPIETANMRIVIPNDICIEKFSDYGTSIFAMLLRNIKESNNLATLRDTLLPKLMNNEISL